jgi:hypothetical protein
VGGRMVMKRPMVAFLTQLLLAIRSWFTRRGLRPRISSCAKAGSSAAQLPDAREPVEHRSLAVGIASRLGGKGEPDPSSGASF